MPVPMEAPEFPDGDLSETALETYDTLYTTRLPGVVKLKDLAVGQVQRRDGDVVLPVSRTMMKDVEAWMHIPEDPSVVDVREMAEDVYETVDSCVEYETSFEDAGDFFDMTVFVPLEPEAVDPETMAVRVLTALSSDVKEECQQLRDRHLPV